MRSATSSATIAEEDTSHHGREMKFDGSDELPPIPVSHVTNILHAMQEILEDKRSDYARGSEDPFVNFKETAQINGLLPEQVALVQCGIKLSRLNHLLDSDQPVRNESIADSFIDLANYAVLAAAMWQERTVDQ